MITYFLLNEESRAFITAGRNRIKMPFDWDADPLCKVANLEVPEHATGHDEARMRAFTADAGFSLSEIVYGDWCGRPSLLGLQDAMVVIKR